MKIIDSLLPFLLIGSLAIISCTNKNGQSFPAAGSVEKLSQELDEIIAPGILPEIIADSFIWSEGPVWVPGLNAVLFSDIPQNSVYQWSEKDGLKLYLKPSGYTGEIPRGGESGSNGLLLDGRGRLVLCQHGDRRMARMEAELSSPAPVFTTLADRWEGKRFNSPNDAVSHKNGDLYFTDPAYGMELKWNDPKREIDFAGLFKLSPNGKVTLLIDSISSPNGVGLSPDGSKLYLACSGKNSILYEYEITDSGGFSEGRILFDARKLKESRRGSCDGMCVREDGIIFATGPGGVLVLDPDGRHLGTIMTGQATSNCTLSDDNRWLFITADMFLMRIELK